MMETTLEWSPSPYKSGKGATRERALLPGGDKWLAGWEVPGARREIDGRDQIFHVALPAGSYMACGNGRGKTTYYAVREDEIVEIGFADVPATARIPTGGY